MATITLRPNGDYDLVLSGSTVVMTPSSPPYYVAVDEVILDVGDIVSSSNGYNNILFSFPLSYIPLGSAINSVKLYAYYDNNASEPAFFLHDFNTQYDEDSMSGSTPSCLLVKEFTSNPSTGVAWTINDVDSIKAGGNSGVWGKAAGAIQQFYIEVDYTEQSGTTHEGEVALSSLSYLRTKKETQAPSTNMIVAGAGTTFLNGTYIESGTGLGGKPYYIFTDCRIFWQSTRWAIAYGIDTYYWSSDNTITPDLCTTWTAQDGAAPVPTVTAE